MPAPTAGIWMTSTAMASPQSAAHEPDTPTPGPTGGARARRELIFLGIALACGLILMPFLIWLVGNRVLGPYIHGQDATAGTGPLRLLADYFAGLAQGSVIFWCVAIGPYVLLLLARLLYAFLRAKPGAAPPAKRADLNRGRIEPHL